MNYPTRFPYLAMIWYPLKCCGANPRKGQIVTVIGPSKVLKKLDTLTCRRCNTTLRAEPAVKLDLKVSWGQVPEIQLYRLKPLSDPDALAIYNMEEVQKYKKSTSTV